MWQGSGGRVTTCGIWSDSCNVLVGQCQTLGSEWMGRNTERVTSNRSLYVLAHPNQKEEGTNAIDTSTATPEDKIIMISKVMNYGQRRGVGWRRSIILTIESPYFTSKEDPNARTDRHEFRLLVRRFLFGANSSK